MLYVDKKKIDRLDENQRQKRILFATNAKKNST